MEYLSPWEIARYQQRDDQLNAGYNQTLAMNQYQRDQLGLRNQIGVDEFNWTQDQGRNRMPGSFVGRGIFHSGIFGQALSDYTVQRQRGADSMRLGFTQAGSQIDMNDANANNQRIAGLDATEYDRTARRAQLASQIQAGM